jgi:hypothetical protein
MTPKKTRSAALEKHEAAPEVPSLNSPHLYINRELSLLAFQRRVLEEAQNQHNPLLERVKFISIAGSNMDEFFMVRVAGLIDQVDAGIVDVGPDGMQPSAQLVRMPTNACTTRSCPRWPRPASKFWITPRSMRSSWPSPILISRRPSFQS